MTAHFHHVDQPGVTDGHSLSGRHLVKPLVIASSFLLLFVTVFALAFHDPRPRDVSIGIVGPSEVAREFQGQMGSAAPGAFSIEPYESPEHARAAIENREISAALVMTQQQPELFIASAAGDATASAIAGAFEQAAGSGDRQLAVLDIRPLPENDSRGSVAFFLVLGLTISGLMYQMVSAFLPGRRTAWTNLASVLVFPLLVGLLVVGTIRGVTGALEGSFWGVTGIATMLSLAVVCTAAALQGAIGPAGIGLAGLTFILVGISSTGGPLGPGLLPTWLQAFSPVMPQGAAVEAIRNTLYFDANAVSQPLTVLTIWIVTALTLLLAIERPWRREQTTTPESPAR
jgi:hypothetical protein